MLGRVVRETAASGASRVANICRKISLCLPQIPSAAGDGRVVQAANQNVRAALRREQWTSTRNRRRDLANKGSLVLSGSENRHTCFWIGIAASTVKFRLRAARSGGEARQLVVWQPRLRLPKAARAAVPVCPWPVRGASWIRDTTRQLNTHNLGSCEVRYP